jgi:predicted transcriptional regulator
MRETRNNTGESILAARVDRELRTKLERIARRNDRSTSAELRVALRRHVADMRDVDDLDEAA